jgi:metal-responsive CopG/Arc/MetJ family transcriptional regulator
MRIRLSVIISDDLVEKIDAVTGDRLKRSQTIETAIKEYLAKQDPALFEKQDPKAIAKAKASPGKAKVNAS